jgi:hypothetical protein
MKKGCSWLFLLAGVVLFVNCGGKEAGFIRLIDLLEKKDVVSSPLVGLDSYFPKIIQKCEGKDFRKIEVNSRSYWAIPTQKPIACEVDLDVPLGMSVIGDGREIPYSWSPRADSLSWRWLKGEEGIAFDKFLKQSPAGRFGILEKGAGFGRNFIFPPGLARVEISAKSGDTSSYLPRLEVEINGRKTREIVIGGFQDYVFHEEMKFGENNISVSFKDSLRVRPRSRGEDPETVFLRNLKVRVWNDLVLLAAPSNPPQLAGVYEFQFIPEPVDGIYSIKKCLATGAVLSQPFENQPGGRCVVDVIFQSLSGDGTLKLRLGGNEIGSKEILSRALRDL